MIFRALLTILFMLAVLIACTVNYVTGSDNDISMSEHRGLIVTPDEDTDLDE